jgi:putative radical SAM enzyme (TIGR03279 family)
VAVLTRHARITVVRIAAIESGSIAEELELQIGTRIVRINGQRVRDGIDLTFMLADPEVEIETLAPSGETVIYEVARDPGDPVGIVPVPDPVRECANKCVFCFIDGNPPGVRDSLWLKDDDFRLSFTYGNYVTLTNLGPKGLARLVEQRLSPLYVSVHATEPAVRERLLVNDTAGLIMDHLRHLLSGGLEVHTQVVLCPGWNDGVHLERTLDDLWTLGEGILSLSVVPVGLTRYNLHRPVRLLVPTDAETALSQIERARERALAERGTGWAYAADELFLLAGRELPDADYYDDFDLAENGVGTVRRFVDDFDVGLANVPSLSGMKIRITTARSMAPFMRERAPQLAAATDASVEVVEVENRFFGETVSVAGLLAGRDIADALGTGSEGDLVLVPAEALNADMMFIDSLPLDGLTARMAPARVIPGYEVTAALRSL